MKILGIGVDIVENARIKKSIKNKMFVKRVFAINEIKESKNINNKVAFYSKRFSAKEAYTKALGTGFRNGLNYNDISVINDKYGKPSIKVNKKIKILMEKKFKTKKINIHLSISDEKNHSISFVIIQK